MYEKIKQPPQKKTGQILNKDGWTWCGLLHPVLPPVLSIIVQKQLLMNYIHGKKNTKKTHLIFFLSISLWRKFGCKEVEHKPWEGTLKTWHEVAKWWISAANGLVLFIATIVVTLVR